MSHGTVRHDTSMRNTLQLKRNEKVGRGWECLKKEKEKKSYNF